MILTDLDRSILFSIAAGSTSGLFQSLLEDTLTILIDKEEIQLKRIVSKCLFSAFFWGVLLGVGVFIESLDSNITITQLNRYTILLATYLSINPLYYRAVSFIFSLFKKGKTNSN